LKEVATLAYGDRVEVLQEKKPFFQVRTASGATGWIHATALTTTKIVMKAGSEKVDTSVSSEEVYEAGKGFNKQVEKEYRTRNPKIDFTWVDKMGTWKVSQQEMIAFLKEGGVTPPEGAMP